MNGNNPKNITEKLASIYAILGIIILLLNLAITGKSENQTGVKPIEEFLLNNSWIAYTVAAFIALSLLFASNIASFIELRKLKSKKLSNIIIEKKEIFLEIEDNGKKSFYQEKTDFCKIGYGKKFNDGAYMEIFSSGAIEPVSALHCAYRLNSEKTIAELEYVEHFPEKSFWDFSSRKIHKFLMFSAIFHDTFTGNEHSWDLVPRHYYKKYYLQILLDVGQILKSASIVIVDKDSSGKEVEKHLPHILPVVSQQNGRVKITMHLVDYDQATKYRLKWKIV